MEDWASGEGLRQLLLMLEGEATLLITQDIVVGKKDKIPVLVELLF